LEPWYFFVLFFKLSLKNLFLDLKNLKLSITKASALFDKHSIEPLKSESSKIMEMQNSKKTKLKSWSENEEELDVETLDSAELKNLVKTMTEKLKSLSNQNQNLLQEIEKLKSLRDEEKREHEELSAFQNKEIETLQIMCRELTNDNNPNKTNKDEGQLTIAIKKEKKFKNKSPDNSPDFLVLQQEMDDICQKLPSDEENFKQNSQNFQFQFKRMEAKSENKIEQMNLELKNTCSDLILVEDIRIFSSESNTIKQTQLILIK